MLRRVAPRALPLALLLSACGADDGAPASSTAPPRDLVIRVTGEPAHADRLAEFSVYDARDALAARAVLRGYTADDALTLPGALPAGAARVEWFFDTNASLAYEPPPADRAARALLAAAQEAQTVEVRPDAPAADISRARADGATLTGHFTEFEVHVGVFFQLRVTADDTGQTVGFFRYRALPAAGRFDVALRGIVREGVRYTAQWFIDLNDNGVYDPRGDHGASLSFVGRAGEVVFHHMHHANRTWAE